MTDYLKHATRIAQEAGEVLKKYWGKLNQIQEKTFSWDLVTEADKESEEVILNELKTRFPDHSILSEEAGEYLL